MAAPLPPITADGILLYSLFGTLAGQRIITTFHYKCIGAQATEAGELTLTRFLTYQSDTGGVQTEILKLFPQNYTMDFHQVQQIYPTRIRYVRGLLEEPGEHAADASTANVALSITRRSTDPTRKGVGHVQIPLADGLYAGGVINLAAITAELADFEEAAITSFAPLESPYEFQPVLFGKDPFNVGHSSPIFNMNAQDTVRTMHRRTVRLGE